MDDVRDDILEAWAVHNDINGFILDWIPPEGLEAVTLLKTGKPSTGRNVGRIFAHMHELRCARIPAALKMPKLDTSGTLSAGELKEALARSARAAADIVRRAVEGDGLKSWKRPPVTWLVYLISHESHHRGQIAQALKQSGVRPPEEISYGIWAYWGGAAFKPPKPRLRKR